MSSRPSRSSIGFDFLWRVYSYVHTYVGVEVCLCGIEYGKLQHACVHACVAVGDDDLQVAGVCTNVAGTSLVSVSHILTPQQ